MNECCRNNDVFWYLFWKIIFVPEVDANEVGKLKCYHNLEADGFFIMPSICGVPGQPLSCSLYKPYAISNDTLSLPTFTKGAPCHIQQWVLPTLWMVSPPSTAKSKFVHGGFSALLWSSSFQGATAFLLENTELRKKTISTDTSIPNPPSFPPPLSPAPFSGTAGEKLAFVSRQTPSPPTQFSFLNWHFPQPFLQGKCRVEFYESRSNP